MPQMQRPQPQMRQMPQVRAQQPRVEQRRSQPSLIGPPIWQQPNRNAERINRGNQGRGRVEQPRIQPQSIPRQDVFRGQRREQQPNRGWFPDTNAQRGNRGDRGNQNRGNIANIPGARINDNGAFRQDRRNGNFDRNGGRQFDRSSDQNSRGQGPRGNNAWPNNYGAQRSAEVHQRNELRKEFRDDARVARWFTNQYAGQQDYRWNRRDYENRELRRESFLRNVVVNAYGNGGYYDNYYSGYAPSYYDQYNDPYYSAYSPTYYDPYYSSYYDPYYSAYAPSYYDPYYSSYYPVYSFGMPYDPAYYNTYNYNDYPVPYYYGGPTFSISFTSGLGGNAFYSDPSYYDLPYDVVANPYYGDIYPRRAYSELVAYGYDQGYQDGLDAARAGYGTRHYYDPYTYDQTVYSDVAYDPYSSSLGENRRCLSQGYELGYMDALSGGQSYDPYRSGGVDLVSAFVSLVSNVS